MSNSWFLLWQQAQSDPYLQAALSLFALNGLSADQISHLDQAIIDLQNGWITPYNVVTYPLVEQAIAALARVPVLAAPEKWAEIGHALADLEQDAQRRLIGALWITDPENQVTLNLLGTSETPILPIRFTFPFSIVERLQPGEVSETADRAREVLQAAADWLVAQTVGPNSTSQRLLSVLRQGNLVFMLVGTGVSGLNLLHNVLMGRLLVPADYSQLTFIITLQLLIGLLPSALQTIVARYSARYQAQNDRSLLTHLLRQTRRFSWISGLSIAGLLLIASPTLARIFQLNDIYVLLPVIVTLPFFVASGSDRGFLQGTGSYFWLSGAYLGEAIVRLGVGVLLGILLLSVQRGLEGAVLGFAQSMPATWFISWLAVRHFQRVQAGPLSRFEQGEWIQLGRLTLLALIGQALITNSDFILVKNFFTPQEAGFYAAVSVLGRIVYFGALPLTILLVPLIARRQALNQPTRPILILILGAGAIICMGLIVASLLFGEPFVRLLYGEAYLSGASLLAPYALAASLYTLTNLAVTYQIALGKGSETWMPVLAGAAQIVGILLFHQTLMQVIVVQIVLMAILLVAVLSRVLRVGNAVNQQQYLALEAAQDHL